MKEFNWQLPVGCAIGLFIGGWFLEGWTMALIIALAGLIVTLLLSWFRYKKA